MRPFAPYRWNLAKPIQNSVEEREQDMAFENKPKAKPPDMKVPDQNRFGMNQDRDTAEGDEIHKQVEDIFEEAQNLDYGRADLERTMRIHTSARPELSGGDIDADWEQADAAEEVVGGENPTPDESIVEEEGAGVGLTYQDDEPLDVEDKVAKRDREPWELNPASSPDYAERVREEFQEPHPPPPAKKAPAKPTKGPVRAKPKAKARATRTISKARSRTARKGTARRAAARRR